MNGYFVGAVIYADDITLLGPTRSSILSMLSVCDVYARNMDILFNLADPGMSLNCASTRVCRKSASRPGYVVKVRTDPGYVAKQCPRIVMNKIFDWH